MSSSASQFRSHEERGFQDVCVLAGCAGLWAGQAHLIAGCIAQAVHHGHEAWIIPDLDVQRETPHLRARTSLARQTDRQNASWI